MNCLQKIASAVLVAMMIGVFGIRPVEANNQIMTLETNETPPIESPPQIQSYPGPLANILPVIEVWYESSLNFGHLGNPQKEVNILGAVTDADGTVSALTYSLNGGPDTSLRMGTGSVRLIRRGDFNLSIPITSLKPDTNTVVFKARDNDGGTVTKSVSFTYKAGRTWPMPFYVNWSSTSNIHEKAQVVDGLWKITSSGVAPVYFGYDRVIAIGDVNWSEYEVLVPITTRAFYPDPNNPDDAGGVGIISRWSGHFERSSGENPPTGWSNIGAYAYYSNRLGRLALRMDGSTVHSQAYTFNLNRTYLFKLRSETVNGVGRYSFKIWEQGTAEPGWDDSRFTNLVNRSDIEGDPQKGSMLLVAHRVDATFGNVSICPLNGVTYPLNVSTTGNGTINYNPGQQSSYNCGQGVSLTAQPDNGWEFVNWSGAINSTSRTVHFNMTQAVNLTANFRQVSQTPAFQTFLPTVRR